MRNYLIVLLCLLSTACQTGLAKNKTEPADILTDKQAAMMEKQAKIDDKKIKKIDNSNKSKNDKVPQASSAAKAIQTTNATPPVTLQAVDSTLGLTMEQLASTTGGGLVLMAGVEMRSVGDLAFVNTPFEEMAKSLAAKSGCLLQACPGYWFIYLPGYEPLLNISLGNMIDPVIAAKKTAISFGTGTPLYEIMALMSEASKTTFVADNVVAGAQSGALTLAEIPLQHAFEALLKSARIRQEAIKVESTPEYVFIRSVRSAESHSTLLNKDSLTPEQNAMLDKEVRLVFPIAGEPADTKLVSHAVTLQEVLPVLGKQLNLPVELSDEKLGKIPINPCVMPKIRVRTAMDLLIRQWPDPNFGYLFKDNKLIIQRIPPK